MSTIVESYINQLQEELETGNAKEHSYRPALKNLFETINPEVKAVNEPIKSKYGNPDFAFFHKKNFSVRIGYVEAKDIDVDLDEFEKTEQLKRYLGYSNLIVTNYLEFRFFRNGEKYQTIEIAKKEGLYLLFDNSNYDSLEREILAFLEGSPENITNAKRLAEIMGGKAARIRANVQIYLENGNDTKSEELLQIYEAMKKMLVHDLKVDKFADMYAQTLVYGLFVARYYDKTSDNFTRQEARDLVPASNPFLQHFFDHIVGPNFDKRLGYIVDELCEVFTVSDVKEIVRQHYNLFGEVVDKDPIIHFYEDFLKEYDPKLRKEMGAYYTPVPVVKFIIRAVDDILKNDFKLPAGLASTEILEKKTQLQGTKVKEKFHKVQILDPAVGTATFLNEIIKFIHTQFKGQEGLWSSYAEKELIPRLHGFELMMAPYTIAHLKLAITLKETGIEKFNKRLGVYLTNTLEEGIKEDQGLFTAFGLAEAISDEANAASEIKHKTPIMVVIGNPPYSVSSSNKSEWILNLIKDYKKELNDRNIQPLSDDYIKFIRLAEHYISKNGVGIVAMITNNSFLDGRIHRQMRKQLLETFDDIYILDLHGSSKKKETMPNGGKDENVFNIQQGVSINIFVKKNGKKKKNLAKVYHSEIFGRKKSKLENLNGSSIEKIKWEQLNYSDPYYFFVPKDFELEEEYTNGFKINQLFQIYNAGTATGKDSVFVKMNNEELLTSLHNEDVPFDEHNFVNYLYRPFDLRKTIYDSSLIQRLRKKIMDNMLCENIALLACQRQTSFEFQHVFISKFVTDRCSVSLQTGEVGYIFPLYLSSPGQIKDTNLNDKIVKKLEGIVGKTKPTNIFDYVYGFLHSHKYRKKYKEFLKIDFPCVPYPKDKMIFWKLVEKGNKLRKLHLLEDPDITKFSTTFSISGNNAVEKLSFNDEKAFINETQYFGKVPKEVWEFYIGGYQPAQKWLKDRKGRKLEYEDIQHYQKIIASLTKTQEVMREIDNVIDL